MAPAAEAIKQQAARLPGPGRTDRLDPEAIGRQAADTFFCGVLKFREV